MFKVYFIYFLQVYVIASTIQTGVDCSPIKQVDFIENAFIKRSKENESSGSMSPVHRESMTNPPSGEPILASLLPYGGRPPSGQGKHEGSSSTSPKHQPSMPKSPPRPSTSPARRPAIIRHGDSGRTSGRSDHPSRYDRPNPPRRQEMAYHGSPIRTRPSNTSHHSRPYSSGPGFGTQLAGAAAGGAMMGALGMEAVPVIHSHAGRLHSSTVWVQDQSQPAGGCIGSALESCCNCIIGSCCGSSSDDS